ncbi:hypothetical protein ACFP1Z_22890 [Streptomyces gamaensis]|uniref:Uncharacterized protein n=1 Tax=Streptomyces gamaensis TaxID=1763542 RepID=A0ABW0Z7J3_9ACTN
MKFLLDQEVDVTVVAIRPWGLDVESPDGTRGFIDIAKDPAWRSGGRSTAVGSVLRVCVVDDERDPARLSALDVDLEIARRLREEQAKHVR